MAGTTALHTAPGNTVNPATTVMEANGTMEVNRAPLSPSATGELELEPEYVYSTRNQDNVPFGSSPTIGSVIDLICNRFSCNISSFSASPDAAHATAYLEPRSTGDLGQSAQTITLFHRVSGDDPILQGSQTARDNIDFNMSTRACILDQILDRFILSASVEECNTKS